MATYLGLAMGFISILGGLGIAIYAVWLTGKARDMRHRERLAMIDKGLLPASVENGTPVNFGDVRASNRRRREGGIMMVCIGLGLMMMFALTTGWRSIWIGGFVLLFGVASLLIGWLNERDDRMARPQSPRAGEPL